MKFYTALIIGGSLKHTNNSSPQKKFAETGWGRAVTVVSFIGGFFIGKFLWKFLMFPIVGYVASMFAFKKLDKFEKFNMASRNAFGFLSGHLLWIIAGGLLVPGAWSVVAIDVAVMALACGFFLWKPYSKALIGSLIVLQCLAIYTNIQSLSQVAPEMAYAIYTHLLLRGSFIMTAVAGVVKGKTGPESFPPIVEPVRDSIAS